MKQKILFINQYYYPDLASTGQLLTQLCESLAKDFEIVVLTSFPSYSVTTTHRKKLFTQESRNGVRIIRVFSTSFNRKNLLLRALNYITYFTSATICALFLKKPHIVVAQTDPPIIGLVACIVHWLRGSLFCLVCQDVFPEVAVVLQKLKGLPIIIMRYVRDIFFRTSQAIITISDGMKEELVKRGARADRVHVISNWIDTNIVCPVDKNNAFRQQHGLIDSFVVMHSGNIGLSQDFDVILECADKLRQQDIEFVLVGDGAKRAWLAEEIERRRLRRMRIIDYQPLSELRFSLGAADLHLVTLRSGLGNLIVPSKIYGIMGAARAVISALPSESEITNIINRFHCGVICREGDAAEIAAAILRLRDDAETTRLMGERGREVVCRYFSREVVVAQYKEFFSALLKEDGLKK